MTASFYLMETTYFYQIYLLVLLKTFYCFNEEPPGLWMPSPSVDWRISPSTIQVLFRRPRYPSTTQIIRQRSDIFVNDSSNCGALSKFVASWLSNSCSIPCQPIPPTVCRRCTDVGKLPCGGSSSQAPQDSGKMGAYANREVHVLHACVEYLT